MAKRLSAPTADWDGRVQGLVLAEKYGMACYGRG
jgi:hypothetical protein